MVASDDPTEKAAGRGLGILRDEGVDVVVADGELATRARMLNQAFRKHARVGRPWVLFKSAMTLDGKVATRTGDSQWISGEASRGLAHRWRASVDAVVVGIGTALADDPQLTARPDGLPAEQDHQPRRVVFDSLARLSPELPAGDGGASDTAHGRRVAGRGASRHRRAGGGRGPGRRGDRRKRAGARALGTRAARVAGRGVGAAGGRSAPRRRLPGRRRDRRDPPVPRAASCSAGSAARDPLEGKGVEQISEALRALSFECERVGEDLLGLGAPATSGERRDVGHHGVVARASAMFTG